MQPRDNSISFFSVASGYLAERHRLIEKRRAIEQELMVLPKQLVHNDAETVDGSHCSHYELAAANHTTDVVAYEIEKPIVVVDVVMPVPP